MYPGYFKNPVPPMYSIPRIMYPQVQAKTPEICKIPGVLWPAIYGRYVGRIYSATSNSIHAILSSLDRSSSPLLNEYKFIRLSYVDDELLQFYHKN